MTRSRWPKRDSKSVQAALSAHSILSPVLAGLFYILFLTGILSVFSEELRIWETPELPVVTSLTSHGLGQALDNAEAVSETGPSWMNIYLPTSGTPRFRITSNDGAYQFGPEGELYAAQGTPWTDLIVEMHHQLNLPSLIGLTLVGLLGAALLVLSLTGFLALPRIFRDAFSLRLNSSERLRNTHLHNRLAVWTAPFHIAVAFSGAVLGLCSVLAIGIAELDYGGRDGDVFAPMEGDGPTASPAITSQSIVASYETLRTAYPQIEPAIILLRGAGTDQPTLQIMARHPDRLIYGEYYYFNGDGDLTGSAHVSDGTAGQQWFATMYRLHFGSFGGLAVKIVYAVFGCCLVYILISGMQIYFLKRGASARPAIRGEAVWRAYVWAVPAALVSTLALASFLSISGTGLLVSFWGIAMVALAAGAFIGHRAIRWVQLATGILLGLTAASGLAGVLHEGLVWRQIMVAGAFLLISLALLRISQRDASA